MKRFMLLTGLIILLSFTCSCAKRVGMNDTDMPVVTPTTVPGVVNDADSSTAQNIKDAIKWRSD